MTADVVGVEVCMASTAGCTVSTFTVVGAAVWKFAAATGPLVGEIVAVWLVVGAMDANDGAASGALAPKMDGNAVPEVVGDAVVAPLCFDLNKAPPLPPFGPTCEDPAVIPGLVLPPLLKMLALLLRLLLRARVWCSRINSSQFCENAEPEFACC